MTEKTLQEQTRADAEIFRRNDLHQHANLLDEAADRLDVLEAENAKLKSQRDYSEKAYGETLEWAEAQEAENAQLTKAVDDKANRIDGLEDQLAHLHSAKYELQGERTRWKTRAEAAEARLAKAREALEPFAKLADDYPEYVSDEHYVIVDLGECRRALKASTCKEGTGDE